jgi:hypothetical protein
MIHYLLRATALGLQQNVPVSRLQWVLARGGVPAAGRPQFQPLFGLICVQLLQVVQKVVQNTYVLVVDIAWGGGAWGRARLARPRQLRVWGRC